MGDNNEEIEEENDEQDAILEGQGEEVQEEDIEEGEENGQE